MGSVRKSQRETSVVVVGGVDPGGGAGLLRDVATAWALGARVHAVGTAWTEQGAGVHAVEARGPAAVRRALSRTVTEQHPQSVKIGMAVRPATARALIEALAGFRGPVVVDPVLATSRRGALWSARPAALLPLLRRATLVTPNGPEAAALAGRPVVTPADAAAAGRELVEGMGLAAVLVKGGHLRERRARDVVTDVLVTRTSTMWFVRPKVPGPSPRGTGCALATAIAVGLGRGELLAAAIATAADWLASAIAGAHRVGRERHLGPKPPG
jgi:hydroxymethylpyrimidine/phosphomethylpyrimidine kinase